MTRRLARTGARLARSLVTALAEEAYPSALVTIHDSTVAIGTPPRTLVDRLSLTLREGDRLAILGENGSGKTVTAQLLGRAIGGSADGVELTPSSAVACSAGVGREGRAVVHVSFESHRRLLQSEVREYRESRFDVTHLRATLASYLFPELRPDLPHPNGCRRRLTAALRRTWRRVPAREVGLRGTLPRRRDSRRSRSRTTRTHITPASPHSRRPSREARRASLDVGQQTRSRRTALAHAYYCTLYTVLLAA